MKYTVTVTRTEIKDFTVDANTPEEAKHIAEELALDHLWGCEPYGSMEIDEPVNTGKNNTGGRNSGDWNSGDWNSGDWNSGDRNSGNWNSGDRNSGNWNSGNRNSGDRNSGNRNSGNWNSGNWNSGDRNSGNRNSGDWNSGNWNSGNWNSGYFNTHVQTKIFCFNKMSEKEYIEFPDFLYFDLIEWVDISSMTAEEKNAHPESDVIGGYLKKKGYKEAFRESFLEAKKKSDWHEQLAMLKAIPNFDAEIFYEISGIKPEELE